MKEKLRFLIPSYMGKTKEVQELRLRQHKAQLDWILNKELKDFVIEIFPREYKDEWYRKDKRVKYITDDAVPLGHVYAKNYLLKRFYSSPSTWAVYLDNDTILDHEHMGGRTIFKHMLEHSALWETVDMWMPVDPMKEPFRYRWERLKGAGGSLAEVNEGSLKDEQQNPYLLYYILKRIMLTTRGCMFVIRNPNLKSLPEVFFNNEPVSKVPDDLELVIRCIMAGWAVYNCTNCIIKTTTNTEEHTTLSSIWKKQSRSFYAREGKKTICRTIPESKLKVVVDRRTGRTIFKTKSFWDTHWNRHPEKLLIGREKRRPIE